MAFTNTVETVGDAALTRSIIDKSITELNCNLTTSIRQQAFRACSALKSVNFPSVTSVALGAFWQCTALKKADFASAVAFANNAFYGCSALTALILRNTDQISTITGTPFAASAIASGTGYIYVPAALVDQYKSSWSTYASQIRAIEDYPAICDPYSWTSVALAIADGSYKDVYKIGDLVPLDLGTEGEVNMQIAAFDADELADGSGTAPITWISKEFLKTERRMNPSRVTNDDGTYQEGTGGIGGWEKSEMRTYVQSTIKNLVPSDVLSMVKSVNKTSRNYNSAGTAVDNVVTADDLWIPSYREVNLGTNYETSGPIYSIVFPDNASRVKHMAGATSADYWWLRSTGSATNFRCVSNVGGSSSSGIANSSYGVALGFCT